MENNKDILKKTTAMNLYLRIFIGGFLVYLAYTLGIDLKNTTGNDTIVFGAATVLFAVSGVVIVGWSVYRLIKKDYYDPMTDGVAEEAEVSEEVADSENPKKSKDDTDNSTG